MTNSTRLLPGVILVLAASAGPVSAQPDYDPFSPASRAPSLVPSVRPSSQFPGGVMPPPPPSASERGTALDRVTAPVRQAAEQVPDAYGTLTGQPTAPPPAAPGYPPGSYPSPWFTDGPGCCGPLGRNGQVGYEIYSYTGPTWAVGEGAQARRLNTGWMVGGGGRSLLFNTSHDAAWVIDLGLSYQYNRGSEKDPLGLIVLHQPPILSGTTTIRQPDIISRGFLRALYRTNFNFALGRDWWLWGPGTVGLEDGWNIRTGGLIGGRWGTAHVDLVPLDRTLGTYQRRQGVTHGVFVAWHTTAEVPMGSWILFAGCQVQWGYDWMNLIPPLNGNLHNFNLLLTGGVRF
jgi:hypothetical protein